MNSANATSTEDQNWRGGPFTEEEWLTCTDPLTMIRHLRGKVSDRKLRLFACACCRRVWDHLSEEQSRKAVEIAEAFAEGKATSEEMKSAYSALPHVGSMPACVAHANADRAARSAASATADIAWSSVYIDEGVGLFVSEGTDQAANRRRGAESSAQCALLREIIGNPFKPVPLDPAWLTPVVIALAREIYDERAFGRLALLARALEEAGCEKAELLVHCREPGEHVRGCWLIDALLDEGGLATMHPG